MVIEAYLIFLTGLGLPNDSPYLFACSKQTIDPSDRNKATVDGEKAFEQQAEEAQNMTICFR